MTAALEARIAMLERQVARLARRQGAPFSLARSTMAPIDNGVVQTVQLQLDPLSARDNVPVLYNFGFTSNPPVKADFHVAYLDGDRSKAVAIASGHQTYRLTGLGPGDSALYDMRGAYVWLTVNGPLINGAGKPTVIDGDLHVTGEIIRGFGGADQVTVGQHIHAVPEHAGNSSSPTAGT